jgi:hypothetical protein
VKRGLAAKVIRLLLLLLGAAAGAASASVLANKAFSPPTLALGASSVVTATLSNTSTATAANITSFADDISTMGGHATLATSPNLSTTCSGGSASHSGTVVSLSGGVIPVAVDSTHPGTCTVTFTVVGASVGNGINTIPVGALVTDQGSNTTAASQTLQVQSAVLTVAGSSSTTVASSATTTQTFTVTNPTAAQITSTEFAMTLSGSTGENSASFSVSSGSTTCGGSIALSTFPATSGTATASGLTLPANGSCTVTLTVSDPNATAVTVTGNLAISAISDTQGITSDTAISDTSKFVSGNPSLGLSFSPSTVIAGATSSLSVSIANNSTSPLTSVGFIDTLPTYMTLASTPAATLTNCGSGTVSGGGSGTFTLSAATVAAATTLGNSTSASTCTVTVTVNTSASATSTLNDTISSITDAQSLAAQSSSSNLRIATTEFTASNSFNSNSTPRDTPQQVSLQFTNTTSSPLTNGSFTDNLPQSPVSMLYYTSYTPRLSSGCSGGTIASSSGNTVVSGTGIGIAANSSCTVTFEVYLVTGGLPVQTDTNTLAAGAVSFTDGSSNVVTTSSPTSDVLSTGPTFSVSNFSSSASGLAGQPLTVTGKISDNNAPSSVIDTNVVATFTLNSTSSPHKLWLASSPNVTISGGGTCTNLTANASANAESFTVTGSSLNTACTVTYNVVNEGTISGASASYGTGTNSYSSTENNGTSTSTSSKTATFYTTSLLVNDLFTPDSVSSGATATEKVTLDVNGVSSLTKTEADGVTFAQTLPTNVTFAASPNITYSSGCQQTGQTSPLYVISGTKITFSNISLLASGMTPTDCNVTFDVTSESLGNATSTVAAGSVTSMSGATNASAASASLSVVAGVALQNTFLTSSLAIGDVDYVRLVIINSSSGTLNAGTLSDTLPSNLVLASTTAQPSTQSGDPAACGGTLTGTVGSGSFSLAGMSVAGAASSSSPGQCVRYVQVTAASTAAPGTVSNSIAPDALTIGGLQNAAAATAAVMLTAAPNVTLSQAFTPVSITANGVAQLLITIGDSGTLAAPLTGMTLTDT